VYTIGIDIGGTSIKAAAFHNGRIEGGVVRYPTVGDDGKHRVFETIDAAVSGIQDMMASSDARRNCMAIGVGTPGLVDRRGYLAGDAVNIPGWSGVQIKDHLENRFGIPASVANDVNMTAYGEWRLGAGSGSDSVACISLGTGIGGGLIIDGTMIIGNSGMAGEIGHIVVEPGGRKCNCGLSGCLERYSSATGISESARLLASANPDAYEGSLLLETILKDGSRSSSGRPSEKPAPSAKQVYQALAAGDPLAKAVHQLTCRYLAMAAGTLAQTINPHRIIFGGGVMEAGDVIIEGIRDALPEFVLPMSLDSISLVRASLGEKAGVYGAAVKAWDDFAD
jgi:glucokinase